MASDTFVTPSLCIVHAQVADAVTSGKLIQISLQLKSAVYDYTDMKVPHYSIFLLILRNTLVLWTIFAKQLKKYKLFNRFLNLVY